MPATVHMMLTLDQAHAVCAALDLYTRIGIGQWEELAHLVRLGEIPVSRPAAEPRAAPDPVICDRVAALVGAIKQELGYPWNGSNGIGHPHVTPSAHRCFEIQKVLAQALAVHRNPHPAFRGVDYDGLSVRYTQDPAPVARVEASDS